MPPWADTGGRDPLIAAYGVGVEGLVKLLFPVRGAMGDTTPSGLYTRFLTRLKPSTFPVRA